MAKKIKYSKLIGLKKTIKNLLVTYGPAVLLVLINHQNEWLSPGEVATSAPLLAAISYYIKNYIQNK